MVLLRRAEPANGDLSASRKVKRTEADLTFLPLDHRKLDG